MSLNDKQVVEYLERIGLPDARKMPLTTETLFALQQAHLQTVPYENLDIVFAEQPTPLRLDIDDLFDKIVRRKRGGICYELNFLYIELLRSLGFDAQLIAARVKDTGTEFDHVGILVEGLNSGGQDCNQDAYHKIDHGIDARSTWLSDVGFGHASAQPLEFAVGKLQTDGRDQFCFFETERDGETWYELGRSLGLNLSEDDPLDRDAFERAFEFRLLYRQPEEYLDRSTYYATNEASAFRINPIVSIDNGEERTTLSGHHFIQTKNGVREERDIEYPAEFEQLLSEVFEIDLHKPLPDLP